MSIPLMCEQCGDVIGSEDGIMLMTRGMSGNYNSRVSVACPGKGNHSKPKRTVVKSLFGLTQHVTLEYPETYTGSDWCEYIGPPSRFLLWLAMGKDGLTVNHKWAWRGFLGDGWSHVVSDEYREQYAIAQGE